MKYTPNYTHTFKPAFEYEGETYEQIEFKIDALTGNDMLAVEKEMRGFGEDASFPEFSKSYQCRLAARAAKAGGTDVGSDAILAMPANAFNRITNRVRSFLLGMGWSEDGPEDGPEDKQEDKAQANG